eukprot:11269110-Ditylum_brightwellii.AAC.1
MGHFSLLQILQNANIKSTITAEIQAEDNFRVYFAAAVATGQEKPRCLLRKSSGKDIPKRKSNNKPWNDSYKSHCTHLKKAFESVYLHSNSKKVLGLVSIPQRACHQAAQKIQKVRLLWAKAQACQFSDGDWSLVEWSFNYKDGENPKGGRPRKDAPAKHPMRKRVCQPLVGPLNFLNHACESHCNMSW